VVKTAAEEIKLKNSLLEKVNAFLNLDPEKRKTEELDVVCLFVSIPISLSLSLSCSSRFTIPCMFFPSLFSWSLFRWSGGEDG
jgi:hypothetical protein